MSEIRVSFLNPQIRVLTFDSVRCPNRGVILNNRQLQGKNLNFIYKQQVML